MKTHKLATCTHFALYAAAFAATLSHVLAGLVGNDFAGNLYNINTTTGAATLIGNTGVTGLTGISFQPGSGHLFGLTADGGSPSSSRLVKINPTTAATMTVGLTGVSVIEGDLAFNPLNGQLFGMWALGAHQLFTMNPATGAATIIGAIGGSDDPSSLAFNAAGTLFAIDNRQSGLARLYTLNPATGAILTTVTMDVDLGAGNGLAFDPDTGIAYVADGHTGGTAVEHQLYSLNTATGQLTTVGPLGIPNGLAGLAFSPTVIPEPATLLFGFMLAGVCACGRVRSTRPA